MWGKEHRVSVRGGWWESWLNLDASRIILWKSIEENGSERLDGGICLSMRILVTLLRVFSGASDPETGSEVERC